MADKPVTLKDADWLDAGKYELVTASIRLKGRLFKHGDTVELDEEQANRLKHVLTSAKTAAKTASPPADPPAKS
jgi:hypothetical protein